MAGPYAGMKVIEFGRFIAAPYCGQLLADGGADVIKIEPLVGDEARRNGTRLSKTEARQYVNKNRGKRSVAVDLSDQRVRSAIRTLVDGADVVIANFRPGQGEKLGLDYASVSASNPRLVYAENSAFGNRGPLAGKPGMDAILQGYAGLASMTANGPTMQVDPMVDYTAALLLAWGIATALLVRERTGEGQKLDVSLLQAALVIQNNSINHIDAVDDWRHEFVDYLKDAFQRGLSFEEILAQRNSLKPAIQPPYYGFFRTRDGVIALGAGGRGLQKRVAELLGIEDPALADDQFVPPDISVHTAQMRQQTAATLLRETTAHWIEAFDRAGLPAGPVQFKDQVLDDEQVWENDYLVRLQHEEIGAMTVVGAPVKFSASPLSAGPASPPLGRHTLQVLSEAGLDRNRLDRMLADGVIVAA